MSFCVGVVVTNAGRASDPCWVSVPNDECWYGRGSGRVSSGLWSFWSQIFSSSDRIKRLKRVFAASSSVSDQPPLCCTSFGYCISLHKGLYTEVGCAGLWWNSLEFKSWRGPTELEKSIFAALQVSTLGNGLWWCNFRRLVMAWSSSWVSWRTTWLGCTWRWHDGILQVALPRSRVGCGPDLNGSGQFGVARQTDITGGGVLSWKQSKTWWEKWMDFNVKTKICQPVKLQFYFMSVQTHPNRFIHESRCNEIPCRC